MQQFFGCSEQELLELPIPRFWGKYKNVQIIETEKRINFITMTAVAQSKEVNKTLYKLNWQLEQLTGKEKVDSLKDIKKQMKLATKKGKKKKEKKSK